MRRRHSRSMVAGLVLAGLLAAIWLPASAAPTVLVFLDRFDIKAYDNSDGTGAWASPWIEVGESDGVNRGAVRVRGHETHCPDNFCLYLGGWSAAENRGAQRAADLGGADSAELSFLYQRFRRGEGEGRVDVLASGDGGATWTRVRRLPFTTSDATTRRAVIDLGPYISPDTRIRFMLRDGDDEGGIDSSLQIDDVAITASWDDTAATTTTTTTVPPPTTTRAPTTTTTATATTVPPPTTTTVPPAAPPPTSPPEPGSEPPPASTTTTVAAQSVATEPPPSSPNGRPTEGVALSAAAPPEVGEDVMLSEPVSLTPLSRVMATFSTSVEYLSTPAVVYLILAAVLAWLSVKGLERAPGSRRVRLPGLRRR